MVSKPSAGRPATRWVGESDVTRSGWSLLERLQLTQERVEFGVRDLGVVENVIPLLVVANLLAEGFELF